MVGLPVVVAAKYRAGAEVLTVVYRRLPAVRGVPEKRAATARGFAEAIRRIVFVIVGKV